MQHTIDFYINNEFSGIDVGGFAEYPIPRIGETVQLKMEAFEGINVGFELHKVVDIVWEYGMTESKKEEEIVTKVYLERKE